MSQPSLARTAFPDMPLILSSCRCRYALVLACAAIGFSGAGVSPAATVAVDYELSSAAVTTEPITVPNPNGGADITVTPSIVLDSGSFSTRFFVADDAGVISDGDASVIGLEFEGEIVIELATTVEVFGFPVPVSATVSGPLSGAQTTASQGTLVGLAAYLESQPGDYSVDAGPLDCSDSALGVVCGLVEGGLGVEFPVDAISFDAPFPFAAGAFSDLNRRAQTAPGGTGPSSVSADIDFSFPLGDDVTIGFTVATNWDEVGRATFIPEPSAALLALALGATLASRRRRS